MENVVRDKESQEDDGEKRAWTAEAPAFFIEPPLCQAARMLDWIEGAAANQTDIHIVTAKPPGSAKQARATDEQRREPEGHDHRNYRVESIDFSVAMKSAEGAMAAKPSGSAKQSRATDEAAAS